MTKIAKWVRKTRLELGLSQVALAAKLKRSERTVIRWENGHSVPSMNDYFKIQDMKK